MGFKNFKNYLLIGLILTSIVQIGILWDINFRGLPFNLFRELQNSMFTSSDSVKSIQEGLFSPKRVIVSTGAYQSHWIVDKDGDTQDIYNAVWNDAKIYMEKIITDNGVENVSTDDSTWSDVVAMKSVSVEFNTPLSQDIVGFFLNKKPRNESNPDFVELVISPWDSDIYNKCTVYLLDSSNRVHKYNIEMTDKNQKKEAYDTDIQKLAKLQNQQAIRNFAVFSESKIKQAFTIRPDMLVSSSGNKYDKIAQLNVSIPDNFHITQGTRLSDIEFKLRGILGGESDSYDIFTDTKGTVVLKNNNNMYRVYSNGVLEYKKTGKFVNEKGSKTQALKNAVAFVGKLGLAPSNVHIYLSDIEEGKESYKFKFDYEVSNLPVRVNVNLNSKSDEKVNNAIVVESNGDSTLSCWWVVRNIEVLKDKKNQYDINSFDILDSTFAQHPEIKKSKDFSIEDIQVGYMLSGDGTGTKVDPVGLVVEGNNQIYSVKLQLPVKKGD